MPPAFAGHASPAAVQPGGPASRLEWLTLIHVAGLALFTAWDIGGETNFARLVIRGWGSLAVPLIVYACVRRVRRRDGLPSALRWLWPLLVFDVVVLASLFHPSFTRALVGGAAALVDSGSRTLWPSTAVPAATWHTWWEFNAIYLSCFNLALTIVHRRMLRALLVMVTVNALALAVLGTFQKLAHAPGLFFGLQASPNDAFFATFIYRNHWGAFILLSTAAALALVFHYARRIDPEGRRHSPALFDVVATLLMAASVPLSASRSCSVLVLILLLGALAYWLWRLRRGSQAGGAAKTAAIAATVALFLAGIGGSYLLGRPVIERRISQTREQIEEIRLRGSVGSRQQLYADTWRMARAKPLFGWGLGSYATVFQIYNQQVSVEGWVPFYAQAHSDWLQALAEVGLVGTALIFLMAAVPLTLLWRSPPPGPLPGFLLAGCGLLALYALVEFPFANPAVLVTFWLCFFTALRYHRLTVGDA
jgi:O-antigen ligase